jgi:2-oxoglutarate dehydrogenase complex dehydrogenase (E1) component-like enzyme
MDPNVFETANAGFAQALYEDYLRDPASVGDAWRALFDSGVVGEQPAPTHRQPRRSRHHLPALPALTSLRSRAPPCASSRT